MSFLDSVAGMAGKLIGGAIGGPIGAMIGDIAAKFISDMAGKLLNMAQDSIQSSSLPDTAKAAIQSAYNYGFDT